jgi:hypothetical protein
MKERNKQTKLRIERFTVWSAVKLRMIEALKEERILLMSL